MVSDAMVRVYGGMGSRVWGTGYGVRSIGCEAWGMMCGVWGAAFAAVHAIWYVYLMRCETWKRSV